MTDDRISAERLVGIVLLLALIVIGIVDIAAAVGLVRGGNPLPTLGVFALALAWLLWRSGAR